VLVYGGGALGTTATAILRALYPDVEVMVVARFPAQAALARRLGAAVVDPYPREQLLEEAAAWSGGVLQKVEGRCPWLTQGGIDVVYDTVGTGQTAEVGVRLLKSRGTMVKSGVNAPERWEWSPAVLQGDLLGRLQCLRGRGGRRRAPARHRALPAHVGRMDGRSST
jgi:threonine dehydrogenase-like Zn-dependent dehydrogenase